MRLIDADKSIEEYKEIRRKLIEKGADLFGDEIDGLDYIIRQLELQPTAYDVEAVVRGLRLFTDCIMDNRTRLNTYCQRKYNNAACVNISCVSCVMNEVIEIVNRGGRNE